MTKKELKQVFRQTVWMSRKIRLKIRRMVEKEELNSTQDAITQGLKWVTRNEKGGEKE